MTDVDFLGTLYSRVDDVYKREPPVIDALYHSLSLYDPQLSVIHESFAINEA